jgi:hypothetical protein
MISAKDIGQGGSRSEAAWKGFEFFGQALALFDQNLGLVQAAAETACTGQNLSLIHGQLIKWQCWVLSMRSVCANEACCQMLSPWNTVATLAD